MSRGKTQPKISILQIGYEINKENLFVFQN